MLSVVTGTFAFGWTEALVDSMRRGSGGYRVIGNSTYEDPFALLLHRAKTLSEDPETVMVMTKHDVTSKHPHVEALLTDLWHTLMPAVSVSNCQCLVIDADPHEYFAKCMAEGASESFDQMTSTHQLVPLYLSTLHAQVLKRVKAPAYLADTPELLRNFVAAT